MDNKIEFKQEGRFFFGWWIVFYGLLMMTFAYVGFVSLTSLFVVPVTKELGFLRADFMVYFTLEAVASLIFSPILGAIMAKGNLRLYTAAFCFVGFLGYMGFSMSKSLISFYFFAILLGIAFAGTAPVPISLLINRWFGGKLRGTATGIAFLGSGLGVMIMAPPLNQLITNYGWRAGYAALAGVFIVLLIATLIFAVKDPATKGFTRMGVTKEETNVVKNETKEFDIVAKKTPELWLSFISVTVLTIGSSAWITSAVPFLTQCGIGKSQATSYYSYILGSLIIGKPIIGWLVDKIGIKITAVTTAIFYAGVFFSVIFIQYAGPAVLIVTFICYMLGGPSITIIPPLMMNGLFGDKKDYGANVGYMNMGSALGGALGGIVAAKVFDVTGSYTAFWIFATCIVALSAVFRLIAFALNAKRKKGYQHIGTLEPENEN